MKYLGILAVLISMFLLFGCASQSSTTGPATSGTETGSNNSVTTTGTNTTYTTTSPEGNVTVTTNIDSVGSDWCVAGGTYDISGTGGAAGTVTGEIKGYVAYKGGQYCKVDSTANIQGSIIAYTYYVSQDQKDMWVVMNIGGQIQETHVGAGAETPQ